MKIKALISTIAVISCINVSSGSNSSGGCTSPRNLLSSEPFTSRSPAPSILGQRVVSQKEELASKFSSSVTCCQAKNTRWESYKQLSPSEKAVCRSRSCSDGRVCCSMSISAEIEGIEQGVGPGVQFFLDEHLPHGVTGTTVAFFLNGKVSFCLVARKDGGVNGFLRKLGTKDLLISFQITGNEMTMSYFNKEGIFTDRKYDLTDLYDSVVLEVRDERDELTLINTLLCAVNKVRDERDELTLINTLLCAVNKVRGIEKYMEGRSEKEVKNFLISQEKLSPESPLEGLIGMITRLAYQALSKYVELSSPPVLEPSKHTGSSYLRAPYVQGLLEGLLVQVNLEEFSKANLHNNPNPSSSPKSAPANELSLPDLSSSSSSSSSGDSSGSTSSSSSSSGDSSRSAHTPDTGPSSEEG